MADPTVRAPGVDAYLRARDRTPPTGPLSRISDLFLVAAVLCIISLMILPLPALAIDALVGANMLAGVMLLLVAIYIGSPVEFSVFPGVLLITTLFRLSLAIATTRMILLEGHAGHIIDTFGRVVAGGNLVVGLVVFLIITVVQFIVIAKGAERVAEVSARFTLDAMPGKQMSIDSDLRSGLIDKDEARRKRKLLSLESQLHGSLDGAMKFVKGDAIAGLIIIAINLLGGLAVGVAQRGMSLSDALVKYSILTIGDGMVSQIPALLAAMAAGLIVTRTGEPGEGGDLGASIGRQLTAKPRVLLVTGGIAGLMALVPGFPTVVLLALGGCAALTGALASPELRERVLGFAGPARALVGPPSAVDGQQVAMAAEVVAPPVVPLLLAIEGPLVDGLDAAEISRRLESVQRDVMLMLGVPLPRIALHLDATLPKSRWRLMAYELPAAEMPIADNASLDVDQLVQAIDLALRRQAPQFIGPQEAANMLNRAAETMPDLVKDFIRGMSVARCADVMRRLVQEGVGIRNIRLVLEGMIDAADPQADNATIAERVRVTLRRQISHAHAVDGTLHVLLVEPEIETAIRQSLRPSESGVQSVLDPEFAMKLVASVGAAWRANPGTVLLAPPDLRRPLRVLTENELFELPVLAYQEVVPTLRVNVAARVALTPEPPAQLSKDTDA